MSKFHIPSAALDQHIAVLGKTGAGKTWAAKTIVEHLLRQQRQTCVLDPTGAWYGLRLGADGKSRGFDVVLLGGEHADIPLAERSGAAVARLVTEQGASVVIDTSGFTVGEYTRWFIDFAGTLYTTLRNPLQLVIDEAHYFMPQGGAKVDVDTGKMLHAGNRLMSGGRSRGVRGMLITQRPAKLHKDSLTCADTLIAMRVIAPQDRLAIKEWIDGMGDAAGGKTVLDSLAQLKRGEGWVWYPEGGHLERITFPAISTYDSSAAPKHGAKAAPKVTQIDLSEINKALAEAVKEAEANDPKLLRKEVERLRRELAARPSEVREVVKVERVEVPVLANGQLERTEGIVKELTVNLHELRESIGKAVKVPTPQPESCPVVRAASLVPRPAPQRTPPARTSEESTAIPRGEKAILTAAAQHPRGVTREQLTVLTGYKRSSRDAYLQRLRERGFIRMTGDTIEATDEGVAALGSDYEPLPTGDELREHWLKRLPEGERKVLAVLIEHYPNAVQREQIDEATGYKRSSRDAYLQRLSARQLIAVNRGEVTASSELFT